MVVVMLVVVVDDEEEGERWAAIEVRRVVAGEVEEADMHYSPGGGRGGREGGGS